MLPDASTRHASLIACSPCPKPGSLASVAACGRVQDLAPCRNTLAAKNEEIELTTHGLVC